MNKFIFITILLFINSNINSVLAQETINDSFVDNWRWWGYDTTQINTLKDRILTNKYYYILGDSNNLFLNIQIEGSNNDSVLNFIKFYSNGLVYFSPAVYIKDLYQKKTQESFLKFGYWGKWKQSRNRISVFLPEYDFFLSKYFKYTYKLYKEKLVLKKSSHGFMQMDPRKYNSVSGFKNNLIYLNNFIDPKYVQLLKNSALFIKFYNNI